jgi:urease subunit beta
MIPGEYLIDDGEHELNAGRETVSVVVSNTGDRPVQVGSHFHFYEVNTALTFERDKARGFRLNTGTHRGARRARGRSRRLRLQRPRDGSALTLFRDYMK